MMKPDAYSPYPARVSILERLVPTLAFVIAAVSGAVGVAMFIRLYSALKQSENAGPGAFFGGMAEIELVVAIVLVFSAVLCAIGILVSIIRLFTSNTTSSPPGVLFLIAGLLGLVPPYVVSYVLRMMKGTLTGPNATEGGVSLVAEIFMNAAPFALLATVVIAGILLAFALVPFSARFGRKASPIVCPISIEILIFVLIGVYVSEFRASVAERDADRAVAGDDHLQSPETIDPDNYDGDPAINVRPENNTYPMNSNSNSQGKTISRGVLNSKAISLPQPAYPPAARAVRATGAVSVQVLVDERGEVVNANAVSGHPLLRSAAVQAARKARFAPTKLSGQPVKVSGVLTFRFSPK
jgi:TonB family protein